MVVTQLIIRQIPHRLAERPHSAHVLLAIGNHLCHQRRIFVERTVCAGDRQSANQLVASVILPHTCAGEPTDILKRTWSAVGAGLRRCAVELLKRYVDLQRIPKDKTLESSVMSANLSLIPAHLNREKLIRRPCADFLIIKSVGHTQHLGACIHRIVIHAA